MRRKTFGRKEKQTRRSWGRSHRGNSAGTSTSPIRQHQKPNLVESPRWFTVRRKLVKFKSTFKTGLARCPAPSLEAATAEKRYHQAPTGVYRSNILGKLWMDFPLQPLLLAFDGFLSSDLTASFANSFPGSLC